MGKHIVIAQAYDRFARIYEVVKFSAGAEFVFCRKLLNLRLVVVYKSVIQTIKSSSLIIGGGNYLVIKALLVD